MTVRKFLGEFEEFVLLAIINTGENSYGVPISEAIENATGRRPSTGALYITLQRLEDKGYISSRVGEPTAERGGRAKKYFQIEAPGKKALQESHQAKTQMLGAFAFQ